MKNSEMESNNIKTAVSCMGMLSKNGYTTQFKSTPIGLLSLKTGKLYPPKEFKVVNFYQFETYANTFDNEILYVIETNVGENGILLTPMDCDKIYSSKYYA